MTDREKLLLIAENFILHRRNGTTHSGLCYPVNKLGCDLIYTKLLIKCVHDMKDGGNWLCPGFASGRFGDNWTPECDEWRGLFACLMACLTQKEIKEMLLP